MLEKCYWSLQNGDSNLTWFDAHLTTAGIKQAQVANEAWEKQIERKVPFPQSFYVSPLHRCLATAEITFKGLNATPVPFRPVVKEVTSLFTFIFTLTVDACACGAVWIVADGNSCSAKQSASTPATSAPQPRT